MKYLYYALFKKQSDDKIEVTFPDLAPHAATYGTTMSDALHMAHDALEGYLLVVEDLHEKLPKASSPESLTHDTSQLIIPIEVDTTLAREREDNVSIKKTLTIPKYLNDLGKQKSINFSATLTDALKHKLNIL
ncbi:hypothetical protein FAM21834_01493 [Lentilactobacillus parabuchneri]|jgi:predicted RNase H-like HicB family nuclease|uniref:HicB-like antitoxin of toxin-antitoxin system domain-containing protein n=4 Tax=Lentilactobacillus parabuchneri TaxID=152331 RepID=A0A1X1FEB9_9LACO|nr:type II toxin-antitoxin system HicB family antitoxin [Lentilactobacillus parabuchneri]APR07610.1 hypothetical protein FAM21731_01431 [Lentilactobacillus parabuchneri]KRM46020.1 toxin-antitoxin system, antitoxin component, HicB family [Lentilactobacillus parabuchneri DSM 5707 = NBRC 107865]KRN72845.1 toxin-antitoxin system, antitoxin component, HicB family [Lentilactobacillus parabuchneri]MBW0222912.1 type II toxin-antitoxin system HicB family antitoxin [Lentilactobacillus parabuchneri]MBW02